MNYYERHIGDWVKDTVELSMVEDGAYNRLVDQCYHREAPLPLETREVYRLARAVTSTERKAVDSVLARYFDKRVDGWHQKRVELELERFRAKSQKARDSANRRWGKGEERSAVSCSAVRPPGPDHPANAPTAVMPSHMRTHSERSAPQSPVTSSQVSEPSVPPATAPAEAGDELHGDSAAEPTSFRLAPKRKKPRAARAAAEEGPTVAVWRAYSLAYAELYEVDPPRNATVNGQLANLVGKVGKDEAVQLAAFYVRWCADYRGKLHPVDLLLRDYQGLRTRMLRAGRSLPDPATVRPLDARTQYRQDRMAEALGAAAALVGPDATATQACRSFDFEADYVQQDALAAPRRH